MATPFFSIAETKDGSPKIEIFTTSQYLVTDNGAGRYYRLDRIRQLETRLSQNLNTNLEQAKTQALKNLQNLTPEINSELQNAATGLAKAQHYGLKRYPAIVINEQAILYGLTDTDQAITLYQQWQEQNAP